MEEMCRGSKKVEKQQLLLSSSDTLNDWLIDWLTSSKYRKLECVWLKMHLKHFFKLIRWTSRRHTKCFTHHCNKRGLFGCGGASHSVSALLFHVAWWSKRSQVPLGTRVVKGGRMEWTEMSGRDFRQAVRRRNQVNRRINDELEESPSNCGWTLSQRGSAY